MIEIRLWKTDLRFSLLFPAMLLFITASDPSGIAVRCLLASMMHEIGHLVMLAVFREWPSATVINVFGMRIEKREGTRLSHLQDMAISLAGPAVNLIFGIALWLCFGAVDMAVIHMVIGGFNLLPIEPLDGGQALMSVLRYRLSDADVDRVMMGISVLALVPMLWAALMILFHSGYNFTFLAVTLYVAALLWLKRK